MTTPRVVPSLTGRVHRRMLPSTRFAALLSFLLYAANLLLVHLDTAFAARWVAFALWILSIAVVPVTLLYQRRAALRVALSARLRHPLSVLPILVLLLLAIAFSFALLVQYPYISIYDQVRDGGLNAREIVRGEVKNLFGYGRFGAHGLIIPTITAFFFPIFGSSVLTFRVPAALLAILDVSLVYLLVHRAVNRTAAWFSALILLTLPLHLFYGRTEIVVIFSSVFMTAILLLMQHFLRDQSLPAYVLLGLSLGFIANFHGSIVTIALVTVVLILGITGYNGLRAPPRSPLIRSALLLLLFFLVGFGPKILFSSPAGFLHTGEAFAAPTDQPRGQTTSLTATLEKFATQPATLAKNYGKSVLVYVSEPTQTTHYPDWHPLLDPVVAALFLLGLLATVLRSRNGTLRLAAFYAAVIPFTNSAMTDSLNGDNRLSPALPVAAVLAGYGASVALGLIQRLTISVFTDGRRSHLQGDYSSGPRSGWRLAHRQVATVIAGGMAVGYLLIRGTLFFVNQPATKAYSADDYLSMHMIDFVRARPEYRAASQICMGVSPRRFTYFGDEDNRLLVSEQYQYFLAGHTFRIFGSAEIEENELYLSTACNANTGHHFTEYDFCKRDQKFTCPRAGVLKLYAEDERAPARPAEGIAFLGTPWVLGSAPAYIP